MAMSANLVMVFCISLQVTYEKNGNFPECSLESSQGLAYESTLNYVQTVHCSSKGISRNMT
jgi:hypothetical protein